MTNLIIGLCVGLASALALVVLWRIAERVRRDVSGDTPSLRTDGRPAEEPPHEPCQT